MMHFTNRPAAYALIRGNEYYTNVKGRVDFYETYGGTLVVVEMYGEDEGEDILSWMAFFTKKFFPEDVIGKVVEIHMERGNVAAGEIKEFF